ncbi:MAG: ATP-dependent DNA helicase RecG [Candidatus Shapirobacteria bacterium]|jgi:ATP-dependent DNA helicase RecG
MASSIPLPGIGPKTLLKLNRLGIFNLKDLLYHFPSRYLDFSHISPISHLIPGQNFTITGIITDFQNVYTRSHKNLQKATVTDKSGTLNLIWFNQPYLSQTLKVGQTFSFAGTVTLFQNRPTFIAPQYGQYNTGKIIGVYPETEGLTSKWFRSTIQKHLSLLISEVTDPLPPAIIKKFGLAPLSFALTRIHQPQTQSQLTLSRARLALDEILSLLAFSHLQKKSWAIRQPNQQLTATPLIDQKLQKFIARLPFSLTPSQEKSWHEIKSDLVSPNHPMNRLLQGDVGSGKTIVAALACYLTSLNHGLSLIMAPTDILCRQHFQNLKKYFLRLKIPLVLLTASAKTSLDHLKPNSIVVATHAAIYHQKSLSHLALVVIDEQHKFGVKQRSFLSGLKNPPHTLTMTATPIPRTVSLTMLGSLQLSTITSIPNNRLPVKTFLVPNHKQPDCLEWIKHQIDDLHCQVYVVCPFIDPSEKQSAVESATKQYDHFQSIFSPKYSLGLVHGKTTLKARNTVLKNFRQNKIQLLVTTPIIEVGVDIPNASVMIILSADRFGLAQLHQLRGRVGRGSLQSYCFLFAKDPSDQAINRLKHLETHHDGFQIALFDLKSRGPGEVYSFLQHGFPSFKLADISDAKLITQGQQLLASLLSSCPDFNLNNLIQNLPDSTHLSHN